MSRIIKYINYENKAKDKKGKGIYQQNYLLFEVTTSLVVATPKEPSESIAE